MWTDGIIHEKNNCQNMFKYNSEEKALNGNGVCFETITSVNTKATGEASSQVPQLWLYP